MLIDPSHKLERDYKGMVATLHAALAQALPWLHENLKQFDGGSWLLDQRAA